MGGGFGDHGGLVGMRVSVSLSAPRVGRIGKSVSSSRD